MTEGSQLPGAVLAAEERGVLGLMTGMTSNCALGKVQKHIRFLFAHVCGSYIDHFTGHWWIVCCRNLEILNDPFPF